MRGQRVGAAQRQLGALPAVRASYVLQAPKHAAGTRQAEVMVAFEELGCAFSIVKGALTTRADGQLVDVIDLNARLGGMHDGRLGKRGALSSKDLLHESTYPVARPFFAHVDHTLQTTAPEMPDIIIYYVKCLLN